MNKEEAIERLNIHKSTSVFVDSIAEAIDMAIEALSADTVPIEKYHELQHQFVVLGATFADLTEVVRCKDCRWWQDNNGGYPHANCRWCETETPDADDYCSGGELAEQTEYKLPGHDEVMEALDKLTLKPKKGE